MSEHCGIIETSCQQAFAEINRKLDVLDEAIRGNGDPGLKHRIDRLEGAHIAIRRLMWLLVGSIAPFVGAAAWRLLFYLVGSP